MTTSNHAHPRGWPKGAPVNKVTWNGSKPAVELQRDQVVPDGGEIVGGLNTTLVFSNEAARDEWLKWWGGKGK